MTFKVRVTKDYAGFCAGHFVTYGDLCEALHGHNYRVTVSLSGALGADGYVIDFGILKQLMKAVTNTLDHKMLLPTRNERIAVEQNDQRVTVTYGAKAYVFPIEDVVLLDMQNTTAECLAEWIGHALKESLAGYEQGNLSGIEVELEESTGQSASWLDALT